MECRRQAAGGASLHPELRCHSTPAGRRAHLTSRASVATRDAGAFGGARCHRACWKGRRRQLLRVLPAFEPLSERKTPRQSRGASTEPLGWILDALRVQGYAMIRMTAEEFRLVQDLFANSRAFFNHPQPYKESYKFYPVPGGYMTPYPGSHEIFELRRGLCRCPPELAGQAMRAFQFFEQLALDVCKEIGRDIGVDLNSMPTETTATLRCIHYDEPFKNVGAADDMEPPFQAPEVGSMVRIVGMESTDRDLNGLKGTVEAASSDIVTVRIEGAPKAVVAAHNWAKTVSVPLANIRKILLRSPGVYEAHADSSLVTVAPRSTLAGLEVKDLHTGEWLRIEEYMQPDEFLVFAGDPLDYVSAHRYPSLMHRPLVPCNGGHGRLLRTAEDNREHRISTPFFLYPREAAKLEPPGFPKLTFDDIQGNEGGCRDNFPWKGQSCYYSDMVYSPKVPDKN